MENDPSEYQAYLADMAELSAEGYFDDSDDDRPSDDCDDSMDGDHASALASAGFGTDEDYEHNDIDSFYEDRFDIGD